MTDERPLYERWSRDIECRPVPPLDVRSRVLRRLRNSPVADVRPRTLALLAVLIILLAAGFVGWSLVELDRFWSTLTWLNWWYR